MVLLTTFLAAWMVLRLAPETPIGGTLHHALVAWPAERLSRIRPGHILLIVLLAGIVAAALWLFEGDGIPLLSMGAPEIAAFVSSIEVSTYLDIVAALIVSASALRLQTLRGVVSGGIARLRPHRPRTPHTRRERAARPANDDEDRPAVTALAA